MGTGKAPAHQNTFAFYHNPNSKTTKKILSSPNVGVCKRCFDKIEWRKKYRKYKPRTQPGKCNKCHKRNVKAAYHTICTGCSYTTDKDGKTIRMCAMCVKEPVYKSNNDDNDEEMNETIDAINEAMQNSDKPLKLREIKSIQRQVLKKDNRNTNNDDDNDLENETNNDLENETNNDSSAIKDLFLDAIGGEQNFITSVEEYQQIKLV